MKTLDDIVQEAAKAAGEQLAADREMLARSCANCGHGRGDDLSHKCARFGMQYSTIVQGMHGGCSPATLPFWTPVTKRPGFWRRLFGG